MTEALTEYVFLKKNNIKMTEKLILATLLQENIPTPNIIQYTGTSCSL